MHLILLFFFSLTLFASEHKAPIEPYAIYSYKAAVSGEVVRTLWEKEGKNIDGVVVEIDSLLDKKELKLLEQKRQKLLSVIEITKKLLQNQKKIASIQEENYKRIAPLKSKSKTQKEQRLVQALRATNSYLSTKEKLQNLLMQLDDIRRSIATLKDRLDKKRVKAKGYLYKVYVKKGDFVNPGKTLFEVADTSKGRLVLYLFPQEIQDFDKKSLFINGKKVAFKVQKLFKIADKRYINQYRAELIINAPKIFSKIVDVEIR